MNKGIDVASGDIITFLNSDDLYDGPWVLADVANHFANQSLDALYGNLVYFNASKPNLVARFYRSPNNVYKALSWGLIPAHPTLFIRKKMFQCYGKFNPEFKIAGDFDLIARFFKSKNLRYKNLNKVMVRMQLGGISTAGIHSTVLLNKEIFRSCQDNLIKTNHIKLYTRYFKKILEFFKVTN